MPNQVEEVQVTESKTKKTPKEMTFFVLKIVGNVVFYFVLLLLLLFSIMNINAGSKNGGFPNIFGKGFLSVQSNSMTVLSGNKLPDGYDKYEIKQFAKGDLLYVDVVDAKRYQQLKVGDVVTFYDESIKNLNSHRIVYISYNAENQISAVSVQGDLSVCTKGLFDPTDATKIVQNQALQSGGDVQTLTQSQVLGVTTGVSYGTGKVLDNLRQNWLGYFVVPVIIFLIVELFFVIKNVMALTHEKQRVALASDKEQMMADLEAQKEAMRAQILAELKAQEEADKKNEETTTEVEESDEEE